MADQTDALAKLSMIPGDAGDLAEPGEPVAWIYEYGFGNGEWKRYVWLSKPVASPNIRNIRPLYEAPPPPAPAQEGSSPAVSHGEVLGELERLSKAATGGQWRVSATHWGSVGIDSAVPEQEWDGNLTVSGQPTIVIFDDMREPKKAVSLPNARFIVALVEDYRSGKLVPAPLAPALVGDGTGAGEKAAVKFALAIDDHYDRLEFLQAWVDGDTAEWPEFEAAPAPSPTPDPVTAARAIPDDWLQPPSRENAEIQALRAVCMIQARELKLLSPDGKTPADLDDAMAALATLYAHQENDGEVRRG